MDGGADLGEELLTDYPIRTFPCPSCGAILTTSVTHCDVCSITIDAQVAEAAAERRGLVLKANGEASSLVISARMFLPFLGLNLVPFLGTVGRLGVLFLLVQIPWLSFRWYRRYGMLTYPDPELSEARNWWKQSLAIWFVVLVATPLWIYVMYASSR